MARYGNKHTGGRKKGSFNRITSDLIEQLNGMGFNPVAELIEIIDEAKTSFKQERGTKEAPAYLGIAARGASDLMKYVYPQRRAVDHTSGGKPLANSFAEIAKQVLKDDSEENDKS